MARRRSRITSAPNRNMRLFRTTVGSSPDLKEMIRDAELSTDELILEVLTTIRDDLLRFLKGYTNKTVKGDYRAQFGPLFAGRKAPDRNRVEWKDFVKWWNIPRPAHPGGWGDITLDLRQKYRSEVKRLGPADYVLTLDNDSEHAPYVEAMAGFFVTGGVMDPGGYVDKAVQRVFKFVSRRMVRGPRGGLRRGGPTVQSSSDGSNISVRGTP